MPLIGEGVQLRIRQMRREVLPVVERDDFVGLRVPDIDGNSHLVRGETPFVVYEMDRSRRLGTEYLRGPLG